MAGQKSKRHLANSCTAITQQTAPGDFADERPLASGRQEVSAPSLAVARAHIASGKRIRNPSRFGILTFGNVCAFIVSFSPISLFKARI
jgi:hypothetical protein